MKNTYIAIGVVVIVAILAFVFGKNETQAPGDLDNLGTTTPTTFSDGTYKLDTLISKIGWRGEFITGTGEEGTVMLKSGSVTVTEGVVSGGNFVIDMNTITNSTGKEMLEDHLKSDDFFAVATNPEAMFTIVTVEPTSKYASDPTTADSSKYIIGGRLTVRGIEKSISFPATIIAISDDSIQANASFMINRADWEIKYGSNSFFKDLGDKAIRDAVEITLDLKALKE